MFTLSRAYESLEPKGSRDLCTRPTFCLSDTVRAGKDGSFWTRRVSIASSALVCYNFATTMVGQMTFATPSSTDCASTEA